MTDPELLEAAIAAARMTTGRFAAIVGADPRKIRRNLDGTAELSGVLRVLCRAIIARPALAAELGQLHDDEGER